MIEMRSDSKGILLAGGQGTRLAPLTTAISKHLLAVYDKPLIYYSLSNLMLSGARQIGVVCNPSDVSHFSNLLGDGSRFGVSLSYFEQETAGGIPHAILSASEWLDGFPFTLALGDNLFFGTGLSQQLERMHHRGSAAVLLKEVHDPERFGVAELNNSGKVIGIEEKPTTPKTNKAVTGLYFFDESAVARIGNLSPSNRGELEMAELLNSYIHDSSLDSQELARGTFWLDAGTFESLADAGNFVRSVQTYTGHIVGSPHEIAWRKGWVSRSEVLNSLRKEHSPYAEGIRKLIDSS